MGIVKKLKSHFFKPLVRFSDFETPQEYYTQYQYILAKKYIIPLLQKWGIKFNGAKVFDAGCSVGGLAPAVLELGSKYWGIDIVDNIRCIKETQDIRFMIGDLCDTETIMKINEKFDIIFIRDVIEHIADKETFINNILHILDENGAIFFSFPPYYSAFGAHQQALLKSKFKAIPYLQWLPSKIYISLIGHFEKNNIDNWTEFIDIRKNTKTTIRSFKSLIKKMDLEIIGDKYYALRPVFHVRYGVKPREGIVARIPLINEIVASGAYFLVKRR